MRLASAAFLILLSNASYAAADPVGDATLWLKKIANASSQLNYYGTFVYQHGNQVETSRIAHFVDAAGEYERLETLDGPPREIVRNNENVTCYLPENKIVVIEKRTARRFPALLPEQLNGIAENYTIKTGENDRVAGSDCRVVVLEPKDNLRYGHKFCIEVVSGLPLRARMYNEKNEMVESFAFTQVTIGGKLNKGMLKSRYASSSHTWRVDRSALQQAETAFDSGWTLKNHPAGFRKLTEIKRSIAGRSGPVSHIVYSDGLAAVSVFIEPMPKTPVASGASYQGAVNIFVRPQADQMVTVVGETPARTVKQIAESLMPKER